jgi:hypothetical protein
MEDKMFKSFAMLFNLNKEMAKQCKTVQEQQQLMAKMLRDAADRIVYEGHNHGGFWFPQKGMEYDGVFSFFDQEVGFTKELDLKLIQDEE